MMRIVYAIWQFEKAADWIDSMASLLLTETEYAFFGFTWRENPELSVN